MQNNNISELNALFLYENSVTQETILHNSFVFWLTLSSSSIVYEFYISYLIDIGSISHVNFARNDNVTLRKCLFASLIYISPRSFCQIWRSYERIAFFYSIFTLFGSNHYLFTKIKTWFIIDYSPISK